MKKILDKINVLRDELGLPSLILKSEGKNITLFKTGLWKDEWIGTTILKDKMIEVLKNQFKNHVEIYKNECSRFNIKPSKYLIK